MSDLLHRAATRAAARSHFLAHSLLVYRTYNGWDESQLADYLGCAPTALPLLGLCRRPRPEPAHFRDDIHAISQRFALDPARLAALVRWVDAIEALQAGSQAGVLDSGLLAAARDHEAESPDEGEDEP